MAAAGNDQAANLEEGSTFCRRAADLGTDAALLPEMWNVGYTPAAPCYTAELRRTGALARAPFLGRRADIPDRPVAVPSEFGETNEDEGVSLATFGPAALRADRERETWGNAFRHPRRDGPLTPSAVALPFARFNAAEDVYDSTGR